LPLAEATPANLAGHAPIARQRGAQGRAAMLGRRGCRQGGSGGAAGSGAHAPTGGAGGSAGHSGAGVGGTAAGSSGSGGSSPDVPLQGVIPGPESVRRDLVPSRSAQVPRSGQSRKHERLPLANTSRTIEPGHWIPPSVRELRDRSGARKHLLHDRGRRFKSKR